jgi:hypothetical protein
MYVNGSPMKPNFRIFKLSAAAFGSNFKDIFGSFEGNYVLELGVLGGLD